MSRALLFLAAMFALGVCSLNASPARGSRATESSRYGRMPLLLPGEPKRPASGADSQESREETIRRLQQAYDDTLSKLEKDDASAATQQLQKKILQDLDRLIKQPPSPASNSGAPSKARPQPATEPGADHQPGKRPMPPAKPGKLGDGPPSAPRTPVSSTQPANKLPGDPAKLPWVINRPGRQRESADAFARDHCLPQYEELLRRYYRAIADEAQPKSP